MKRRQWLAAWPAAVWAQPAAAPRQIGFLVSFARPAQGEAGPVNGTLRELRALGFAEGPGLRVHTRYGTLPEELTRGAEELLALGVELIVAVWTPAAHAAKRETQRVPIVLYAPADAVATGLVASLAAPGGNITGMSSFGSEVISKNLELLREWLPEARRVAVLASGSDPFAPSLVAALESAAAPLRLQLQVQRAGDDPPYARWFDEWVRQRIDALVVQPTAPQLHVVATLARQHRLPSCSMVASFVRVGGLFAYTISGREIDENVARYVKRILDGESPARLPVLQPSRFELVVNAGTARTIGLAVPPLVGLRATQLIE